MQVGFVLSRFVDRLHARSALSISDSELLSQLPYRLDTIQSHRSVQSAAHKGECCLILQGYASARSGFNREEEVPSFHVPGDIPDLGKIHDSGHELDVSALGAVVVAFIPTSSLKRIADHSSSIRAAFSLMLLAELSILRNAMINVGSRDALTRIAHFFCEFYTRLDSVKLTKEDEIICSFTQADLGAICGISAVHVNRTIQELRERRLLEWRSRTIRILDRSNLIRLADFSPAYLRIPGYEAPDSFGSASHGISARTNGKTKEDRRFRDAGRLSPRFDQSPSDL
jgi:CRP-like cAMP-binding protein